MVSHGSNKYSHAYLTVTQVFYTPSILLASNNRDGEKNIPDTKIIESKRLNEAISMGPAFVLFFFRVHFEIWQNYCHLMPIFCTFQISSSFFSRPLESFEFTCFPLLPLFFYLIIQSWKKWFTTCYWKHRMKLEIIKIYYVHCTIEHLLIGNYIAQMA